MTIFKSRAWLIVEPIILLVALGLLARYLATTAGIDSNAADEALLKSPPRWGDAASVLMQTQTIKWGLLLGAAWVLARMRGYRLTRPVSDVAPPLSIVQLALFGVAIAIPLHLLAILPRWYHFTIAPLGVAPPIWDIIYNSAWTAEFWLFMAIGSFAFVPIVEELFFRGYVLGALYQRFSAISAALLSAAIFTVVHLQYVGLDAFAVINLTNVFITASVFACSVYWTRSLIPALAGHAYGNFPTPLAWAPYQIGLLIISAPLLAWLVPIILQRRAR